MYVCTLFPIVRMFNDDTKVFDTCTIIASNKSGWVLLPSLMNQAENGVIWGVIMIITWTWLLKTKQWLNLIAVESLITGQKAINYP